MRVGGAGEDGEITSDMEILAKSAIIPQTFSIRSFGSKVTVEVEVNRVMHYVFNQTECMLKKC